jgi:Flp pilus assembly pilin Flp
MQTICQFMNEEDGLVAAEYAILLGFIAVALLTAVTTFRGAIGNAIGNAGNALSS